MSSVKEVDVEAEGNLFNYLEILTTVVCPSPIKDDSTNVTASQSGHFVKCWAADEIIIFI